ncbi:hypothetical protein H6G81_15025 [Scytonema hofmannii FACHB-248]|uniref:Uncharacterized protein n=1 Tax=Scytonema hofmannii FACHB-248 TaxID=1842502 RepID=A0ABR8GR10_9CYAN|nr:MULTISPECIES: hypothetical protein [Nostocales]MBD2605793.1 hypothetical protein [Scytonema hofmannii FACHB-248]
MTSKTQQISDYRKKLSSAYRAVYAVGVLNIFLGILAFVAGNKFSEATIIGILFFTFGLLYLLLGFFVQRKSKLALLIAVGFMLLNLLTGIYNMIQTGKPVGLIIPIVFFSQTWEGFKAIQVLKRGT